MFTGIVEEIGTVDSIQKGARSALIRIQARIVTEGAKVGDSIAVNGICLTVTSLSKTGFTADVMPETINRSSLSRLTCGSSVNLERAMAANGRFGGHLVSGHIDGTGTVTEIKRDDNAVWYTISAPARLLKYIVEKGSIAIDGISLTVAEAGTSQFSISAIPHTVKATTLSQRRIGDLVNLETDMAGKYIERFLTFPHLKEGNLPETNIPALTGKSSGQPQAAGSAPAKTKGLSQEFLMKHGFAKGAS